MAYDRTVPRHCLACGVAQPRQYGIPDPCLGTLPGLQWACCGHSYDWLCYVVEDGEFAKPIYGEEARQVQIRLGGNPAPLTRSEYPERGWPGWDEDVTDVTLTSE